MGRMRKRDPWFWSNSSASFPVRFIGGLLEVGELLSSWCVSGEVSLYGEDLPAAMVPFRFGVLVYRGLVWKWGGVFLVGGGIQLSGTATLGTKSVQGWRLVVLASGGEEEMIPEFALVTKVTLLRNETQRKSQKEIK